MSLQMLHPYEFLNLTYSYENIKKIITLISENFNLLDFDINNNTIKNFNKYIDIYENIFDKYEMGKYGLQNIENSFFKKGNFENIDKIQNEIDNINSSFQKECSYLSDMIETNSDFVKIENNDRDGYFLYTTKKRSDVLISNFNKEQKTKYEIKKYNGSNVKIYSKELNDYSDKLVELKEKIKISTKEEYLKQLVNFDEYKDIFYEIIKFIANIDVKKIEFSYPSAETPNIQDFDLQVKPGEIIAIVGPSGAGKTTFVDLLLGILQPNKGQIIVSGVTPLKAIETWPGAIAYVPQDVMIADGTIKENVTLGFPSVAVSDELVWEALKIASLDQFVRDLPGGIDSMVGERGSKLSGGQRQRLGIARAMITKPSLLVLDEATSALDSQIENEISESLSVLKGSTTIIIVAHRLSTVKDADKVVYLESGKKIAEGTFSEVRSKVANFDSQAKLNGF
jgi:ABC-type multidrug transport system fused ATPase/permease subunit